jgi:hypothetical protein
VEYEEEFEDEPDELNQMLESILINRSERNKNISQKQLEKLRENISIDMRYKK